MKPFFLCLLAMFFSVTILAQENWGGGVDDEALHFGFFFYNVNSDLVIQKKDNWRDSYDASAVGRAPVVSDSLSSLSSLYQPGFGIGVITNFRLSENVDFRFTPSLSFVNYLVYYEYTQTRDVLKKKTSSTLIDIPLMLKLKSDRRKNFRSYLIGGPKYTYALGGTKADIDLPEQDKSLAFKKGVLSCDIGVGFDFYFENFKISPEVKYAQSFGNILKSDDTMFSRPIDRIYRRTFQISVYFE